MVRKLLYLAALSVVATLAFSSVAMAQSAYGTSGSTVDCSGAEERDPLGAEYFFLPDAGGCTYEGAEGGPIGPIVADLNKIVWDAQTGERLGIAKDLDPDLSSGANSVTYQEFCGDFPGVPGFTLTAQEYFEQIANAEEQTILDPNGDGQACTAEDGTFSVGDTGASETDGGGQQDQYADETDGAQQDQYGPQCIDGILDRNGDGQISPIEAAQAGADATQGEAPCPGTGEGAGDTGSQFEQTWSGQITYTDGGVSSSSIEYGVEVNTMPIAEMSQDLVGEVVGEVSYPTLDCSGVWVLKEVNESSIVVEEQIKEGTSNCVEIVPITLSPQEDGTLEYRSSEGDDGGVGTGTLTRQGSITERFQQTWTGQITETGEDGTVTAEYGVEADIMPIPEMTEDLVGEVVGEVSYSLDCSGVWVLEEVNENSVQVEEQIKKGLGNCVEFVPLTLTPQEDGTLKYYYPSMINGNIGRGVLTRQGSSAPDGGMDSQQPGDGQQPAPEDGEELTSIVYRTGAATKYIAGNVRDFGAYCGGTMADTVADIRQGRLPDTGGGWAVLLFSGTALVGGGWFLVRRFSR